MCSGNNLSKVFKFLNFPFSISCWLEKENDDKNTNIILKTFIFSQIRAGSNAARL